ncbi:hypothetical protein [Marinifilum caeruleilacunae]|uniref:Lipoprotein n=1 Tax=Marinifilum caeruleilacunae TaxID=2499076 RepID=A0ABX1WY68_9BACT|nr:hypothetical protein [Marinifilum caeruleilacunae]NOU61061.1 hypothetical protein [Marinifilum caeruleilacunae]
MKKFIYSLISIAIIGITIISCNKSDELEFKNEKLKVSDFEYIGKLHNQGLELSLEELKSMDFNLKGSKLSKKESLIELQKNISIKFVNEQIGSDELKAIAISQIQDGINDYNSFDLKLKSTQNNFIPDSLLSKISVDAKNQLHNLFDIMNDSDMNLSSLKSRISAIEEKAIQTLNTEEQFLILSTSSVAKSTLDYWSANYKEWLKLNDQSLKSLDWKAAGQADVGGAALAGLGLAVSGTGAAMAAAGPAGWAGIGLVVVGRGLQASAARMILGLW